MARVEHDTITAQVCRLVAEVSDTAPERLDAQTALIGPQAVLKSRALVELLLALEEYAEESLGVVFDWMSDRAMSPKNSPYRSIGTLAEHLHGLQSE